MNQDILWAPWRIKYLQQKKMAGCIFCKASQERNDKKNLIVKRGKLSFSMLNIFPYNNGHLMVAPFRHVGDLAKLSQDEFLDLFINLKEMKLKLDKILKPQGYNIGINIGRAAGAGFPGHIHIHIVPRWNADTNFMPVIARTKVISQSLKELYKKIKNA